MLKAADIDIGKFLPTVEDYNVHRETMIRVVCKILHNNFAWMKTSKPPAVKIHEYHHESKEASNIVNSFILIIQFQSFILSEV